MPDHTVALKVARRHRTAAGRLGAAQRPHGCIKRRCWCTVTGGTVAAPDGQHVTCSTCEGRGVCPAGRHQRVHCNCDENAGGRRHLSGTPSPESTSAARLAWKTALSRALQQLGTTPPDGPVQWHNAMLHDQTENSHTCSQLSCCGTSQASQTLHHDAGRCVCRTFATAAAGGARRACLSCLGAARW